MTREVAARSAARRVLFLLFPLLAALGLQPAHAARPHAAPAVAAKMKAAKPHAARKRTAHVARKPTKPKALARASHVRPLVAHTEAAGPLRVSANAAYVIDQETGEVLFGKNAQSVQPIASLTKLMTGFIVAEARLPMDETITIADEDVDRVKFSSSRLKVGTELTRAQALHLALMSSENRAAHALARTYPGGESAFVSAMNVKAAQLGMRHTRYVEPTGLSSANQSSAHDLAVLTAAASEQPLLRRYSTSPGYRLGTDDGTLQYVNSNRLVRSGRWDIGVQKTGYIREAGYTMLMQAQLAGRKLIMVFLDSASKLTRVRDAERMRRWLRSHPEQTAGDRTRSPG